MPSIHIAFEKLDAVTPDDMSKIKLVFYRSTSMLTLYLTTKCMEVY